MGPILNQSGLCRACLLVMLVTRAVLPSPARAADEPSAAPAMPAIPSSVEGAVVKVFATMRYPDPYKPWTKQSPSEVTASGVVIEGKRILTNAHVVLYASQVQIQASAA